MPAPTGFNAITAIVIGGRGLVIGTVLLAVLFVASIWLITLSLVAEERRQALNTSTLESRNIASIVAANLNEVLRRAVLYARLGAGSDRQTAPADDLLNPFSLGDPAYLRIAMFSADGRVRRVSSPGPIDQGLVSLVRAVARGEAGQRPALLGKPDGEAGAPWSIPVAVPMIDNGEIARVFVAYIDLGYLLNLYKETSIGSGNRVEVIDAQGRQLIEIGKGTLSLGRDLSPPDVRRLLGGAEPAGAIDAVWPGSGEARVGAFRHLDSFKAVVAVTRERDAVFDELENRHLNYIWRATLMTAAVVLLVSGLTVLAQRQRRLNQHLVRSEHQNHDLIRQLEEEKARAFQLASHDFLTGLPNRRMFHEMAGVELARARRSRKTYALLFLDIDKFKPINDTLGHAVGDLLLRAVADRLRKSLRDYDLIARLGGDEFVVLVSELDSDERVAAIAAKLVETLSAPYHDLDGNTVDTTPSIGVALYPRDGQTVDALLSKADAAMYEAKRRGRGKYRFHDGALNTSSARMLELLTRFQRAIRDDEFCVHYQFRVGLDDLRPVGMEALLRWRHPEHGLIFPKEFIELAEKHDYIVPLGHWTIGAVCDQLARWRDAGRMLIPVAINISARQLADDTLVGVVMHHIGRHNLPPELIEIEVTESSFLDNPDAASQVLERLHLGGIRISLDDYGTGFSGLSHLKRLPISAVKIDRSFIRDIRNDTSDAMIVSSTISLSHNLGLKVVAEGVETREQVVHLKAAGCDEVQGFYFHRPAPADELPLTLDSFSTLA